MVRIFAKEVLPVQRAMKVEMSNVGVKERQFVFPRPLIRSSLIYIQCTSYVYTAPSSHTLHLICVYNTYLPFIYTAPSPLLLLRIVYTHVHNPYDPNLYDTFPQMSGTCTHRWILGWSSIVPQLAANYCSPRSLL